MFTRPCEWIKQYGGVEKFKPDHVLIVLPDELDLLFCSDLDGCCYGPEVDDSISFCSDENSKTEPTVVLKGIFEFLKNYDGTKLWNKKKAICYAQDLRNALADSYDVWCNSRLDLIHDDLKEKRPFRIKKPPVYNRARKSLLLKRNPSGGKREFDCET